MAIYHAYVREEGDSAPFGETQPRSLTFEISRCHDARSVRPSVHAGRVPDTDPRSVACPSQRVRHLSKNSSRLKAKRKSSDVCVPRAKMAVHMT